MVSVHFSIYKSCEKVSDSENITYTLIVYKILSIFIHKTAVLAEVQKPRVACLRIEKGVTIAGIVRLSCSFSRQSKCMLC